MHSTCNGMLNKAYRRSSWLKKATIRTIISYWLAHSSRVSFEEQRSNNLVAFIHCFAIIFGQYKNRKEYYMRALPFLQRLYVEYIEKGIVPSLLINS